MQGVDIRTTQALLGHADIRMTLRYSHLSPAHLLDAVEKLAERRTGTTTGTERLRAEIPPVTDPTKVRINEGI